MRLLLSFLIKKKPQTNQTTHKTQNHSQLKQKTTFFLRKGLLKLRRWQQTSAVPCCVNQAHQINSVSVSLKALKLFYWHLSGFQCHATKQSLLTRHACSCNSGSKKVFRTGKLKVQVNI